MEKTQNKHDSMMIAIVAIVAVVAIVILVMNAKNNSLNNNLIGNTFSTAPAEVGAENCDFYWTSGGCLSYCEGHNPGTVPDIWCDQNIGPRTPSILTR